MKNLYVVANVAKIKRKPVLGMEYVAKYVSVECCNKLIREMNDNIRRYDLDIPLYSEFPYSLVDESIYIDLTFIADKVAGRASEKKKANLSKSSSSHNSDDSNNKDKQIADLTKLVMQLTTQVSSLAALVSNSKN